MTWWLEQKCKIFLSYFSPTRYCTFFNTWSFCWSQDNTSIKPKNPSMLNTPEFVPELADGNISSRMAVLRLLSIEGNIEMKVREGSTYLKTNANVIILIWQGGAFIFIVQIFNFNLSLCLVHLNDEVQKTYMRPWENNFVLKFVLITIDMQNYDFSTLIHNR